MDGLTLWILVAGATFYVLANAILTSRADRHRQEALDESFDGVLTSRGRATLDEIGLIVSDNNFVLERYHAHTLEYRRTGSYGEAIVWLQRGCEAIEKLAPDLQAALRTLNGLARSVSVIVALPPLRPYAFRAWELRGLVGLSSLLHHLLISGRERIMLRAQVLIYALGLSVRWFRRSTNRLTSSPATQAEWRRIDDLVADVVTTSVESEQTAVRIVQALDAVVIMRGLPPATAQGVGKA